IGLSADLPAVAAEAGASVVATVHEYWYACQRVMLQYADGGRCGGPATASCIACVMSDEGKRARPPRSSLAARLGAQLRGRFGGPAAVGPEENRARFRALRAALDRYERITTPSRFVVDELGRQGMPIERAAVLPLGVAKEAFA